MRNSITFKGEEIADLYYALTTAYCYSLDMLKKAKDICLHNLTAENCDLCSKWEIKCEKTKALMEKTFEPIYYKLIKNGGKL